MKTPDAAYPMRINKYLAHQGLSTRRGADELINKGLVTINGVTAKLGDQVKEHDRVVVSDKILEKIASQYRYIAYHKPVGVSTDVQGDTRSIRSELPALRGLFPLGRLDKDSHGLIILTNDGRLTERLLNPEHAHEKEYHVRIDKPVTDAFVRRLERGVLIEGYKTKPAKARRSGETIFNISLTEGKRHQIRRMCAALGSKVIDLERIRIMNVKLGTLKSGEYRDIKGSELNLLLKSLNLVDKSTK